MVIACEAHNLSSYSRYQEFSFVEAIYIRLTGMKAEFSPVLFRDAFDSINNRNICGLINDN